MSILKKEEILKRAFENYFSTRGRLMFELNQLTELLKIQQDVQQVLQKAWSKVKQQKSILIFKWLIFINKLIMQFVVQPVSLCQIIEKISIIEENEFDELLNNKLIKPYKLYLMKRCQYLPKKSQNIDKMYQLINLIQAATCFSQIIYMFGRYYSKVYPFAADFNIVLGNDLNIVYNQMVKYTPKPASCEILEQYQKIHEKMYIIYYNCYYYKYMKPFVPRWVVTDVLSPQNKSIIKTPPALSSNKSLADTIDTQSMHKVQKSISSKKLRQVSEFDLFKSEVFQTSTIKSKQLQQSLLLLKSMERVFEQLEQI